MATLLEDVKKLRDDFVALGESHSLATRRVVDKKEFDEHFIKMNAALDCATRIAKLIEKHTENS